MGLALLFAGCGGEEPLKPEDYNTRLIILPDGAKIRAEVKTRPEEIMTGMKYRDALPVNRGMLFQYAKEGLYSFWMYEVKVPLDMIWLDMHRRVVEIAPNTVPCPGPPEKCASYGGTKPAMFIVELAAGQAARHGVTVGQILDF